MQRTATEQPPAVSPQPITYSDLFRVFLQVGLTFGGGLALLATLEDELVSKRQALSHDEFLTLYSIGRIVPAGTTTALAVAYGYRFGGLPGTVVALLGLTLPALASILVLTAAYNYLRGAELLDWLPFTILPAALAFIVAAALRLSRNLFGSVAEILIAFGVFVAATAFDLNPTVLLVVGGVIGMVASGRSRKATP